MKKIISLVLLLVVLAGCKETANGKTDVVCYSNGVEIYSARVDDYYQASSGAFNVYIDNNKISVSGDCVFTPVNQND